MLPRDTSSEINKAKQVILQRLKVHQESQLKLLQAENQKPEKTKFKFFKTHKKNNQVIVPELFNYESAIEKLIHDVNEFIDSEDFSSENRETFKDFLDALYYETGDEELRLQSKVLYLYLFRISPKIEDKKIQNDAKYISAIGGSPVYKSAQSLSEPADPIELRQKLIMLDSWQKIMANQPPETDNKRDKKGPAINQALAKKYF